MHHHTIGKCIAWSAVCIGFAVIFFYVLNQAFLTPISGARQLAVFISRIILPIILFSAYLAACGIQSMIVPKTAWRIIPIVISGFAMFVFFSFNTWGLLACALFIIALVAYAFSVKSDYQSRLKVQPIYTLGSGLGGSLMLMLIAISLLAYSAFITHLDDEVAFRTALRDSISESTIQIMATQISGFTPDMTLDAFIANAITGRLKSNLIPQLTIDQNQSSENQQTIEELRKALEKQSGKPVSTNQATQAFEEATSQDAQDTVTRLVEAQLTAAQQDLIDQVRKEMLSSLGITASGTDTMRTVIGDLVDRRVLIYIEPYLRFMPAVFTLSLFFVLVIFSFLYKYLTRGFGMVWYGILRVTHFIKVQEQDVKAQRIILD